MIPHGSIPSLLLTLATLHSVCNLTPNARSLLVDDFSVSCRSKYMHSIEGHLQQCLKCSQPQRLVCMHRCRLHHFHHRPSIFLPDTPIPVMVTYTSLGMILDSKYFFTHHIQYITIEKTRMQPWSLANSVSCSRALVRSKLDYARALLWFCPTYLYSLYILSHMEASEILFTDIHIHRLLYSHHGNKTLSQSCS